MSYKNILINIQNNIATVFLNRPKSLNALNTDMVLELDKAFDELAGNLQVMVIIITGEKNFAAGADISNMLDLSPEQAKEFSFRKTFSKIEDCPKPIIAAITGFALGGGMELALCCDFRIASPSAKMGFPEINLGIFPGAGGTQRLPRLIGPARAKKMIYTGNMIDANTALEYGLIDDFTENPLEEAMRIALEFSNKAPIALKMAKQCINLANDVDAKTGFEFEAVSWASMFATEDQKEGMQAFVGRRGPKFIGA
jgi:enoyl-CoA hydratase